MNANDFIRTLCFSSLYATELTCILQGFSKTFVFLPVCWYSKTNINNVHCCVSILQLKLCSIDLDDVIVTLLI